MLIGLRIKELREAKKLTQKELAAILGLKSDVSVSDYEKSESLTVKTLTKIAKALDVSVSDITNEDRETKELAVQEKEVAYGISDLTYKELLGRYINTLTENSSLKDEIIELQKKIIAKSGYK